MTTILAVHGTFAGGPETGEKWWQKGSLFEKHINQLVEAEDGELIYKPIIWDGQNSETSRREAGLALFNKMKVLEETGEPYAVVGHSHGGSVISAALMESAKQKNPLKYLTRWITIGTPFIKTQRERFLFNRLGLIGKAVFVALWTGTLLAMLVLAPIFLEGRDLSQPAVEDAVNLMQFLVVLCFPIFLFYIGMRYLEWRHFHIYNMNTIAFSNKRFRHRWVSLWHENDEAVQGLRSLKSLNFKIFSKRFARAPLGLLSVFILPVIVLLAVNAPSVMRELHNCAEKYGSLSGEFHLIDNSQQFGSRDESPSARMDGLCNAVSGNLEKQNSKGHIPALKGNGQDIQRNAAMLIEISVLAVARATRTETLLNPETFLGSIHVFICLAAAMLILALLITVAAKFMVKWTSCFLSWTLNPVAIGQIRATALGSDTTADYAIDVDAWPMWLGNGYPPLPEPLGPQLQASSDAAVSKVVPKFRNALRQFTTAESKAEKSDMLSEYLTWDELIHTSYFHDAQFRKLVAFALTQAEGFRASEAFKCDPDFALVGGWYKDLIGAIQNVDVA